jgi:hypothetical protein
LSDRKYRQPGYQDGGDNDRKNNDRGSIARRDGETRRPDGPAKRDYSFGPRAIQMAGTRDVSRCAQCGTVLQNLSDPAGACPKCGFELHSCKQCTSFDPGSRFECMQPIPVRIPRKDAKNNCTFYSMRVTREKETSTPASARPSDARQAFENLFKK